MQLRKFDWLNGFDLSIRTGWEHDFFRRGVESGEQFFDQARFNAAGFARRNNVADNGIEPGVFADTKDDPRALVHFKFIDGSFSK